MIRVVKKSGDPHIRDTRHTQIALWGLLETQTIFKICNSTYFKLQLTSFVFYTLSLFHISLLVFQKSSRSYKMGPNALFLLTLYIRNIISNFTLLSNIFEYNFWTERGFDCCQTKINRKVFSPLFQFVDLFLALNMLNVSKPMTHISP